MRRDIKKVKFKPLGDSGILVVFGDEISPDINERVRNFAAQLSAVLPYGVLEIIPAYADVLVLYNPLMVTFNELLKELKVRADQDGALGSSTPKTHRIPVCYEPEYAPDMQTVCEHNNLSRERVIEMHTASEYRIYMMGFTPGFCYLGGMDTRIATPRKATPRLKIPAGAVGIAGEQTGIYPVESPGGWQIIGQTPLTFFQPELENPFLVQQGDYLRFIPISAHEFQQIAAKGKPAKR